MMVYMNERGQVVVPKNIRGRRGYVKGSAFVVRKTKNGSLYLRPVNPKPKLDLIEHLKRLKGLEIPEIHAHPPRI